jgi:eukaryotic-like serine/threonine-protein kinase
VPKPEDEDLGATMAPTRAPATRPGDRTPTPSHGFAPGSVIAGRYRLVAMLGRGGMGEVYRADDLTLDHPVALKFLPPDVASDPDRLAQFHNELRIARQVSHKNVCRLYDLGEHEGRRFLTMEYVDGEDLASLLRRIGRVPQDKAIDISRQLCAGLAAAHERGVLHRDLKPANVMIDGDGNVRIADFGLAVAAGDAAASRAGTPQYMAPELLAGGQPSVKTDLYALGLVLFELFTGRRVYEAKTLNELVDLQQSGAISTPSSVVRDLDPAVERVILRCLERDPALRPGSALAVAAALPGGDPLAAALAAGETPSPEMVAAAGETSAFSAAMGLSLLALIIVGLIAAAALSDRTLLLARIPLDKTVDALEDRARDVVKKLGYTERPADAAHGFFVLQDYISYVLRTDQSASRWESLSNGAFPTLRFWYRTSPRPLDPLGSDWSPGFGDPPMTITNMVGLVLDTQGRLTQFTAVPPQVDDAATKATVDWARLFDAAGLEFDRFEPTTLLWVPNVYADERMAWEGPLPGNPEVRLRVEAAAYHGRPAFFQVVGPWTRRPRMEEVQQRGAGVMRFGIFLIVLVLFGGALALARHNLRNGRGDRRGATRLATFVLCVMIVSWVLGARHSLEPLTELNAFLEDVLAPQLLNAGILWVVYIALEPYVRRYCPEILISWSRLLGGRFRDARVGRDLLVGVAAGVGVQFLRYGLFLLPGILGYAPPPPRGTNFAFLLGTRHALSMLLRMPTTALFNSLLITLTFVVARVVFKRVWLAAATAGVIFSFLVIAEAGTEQLSVNILFALTVSAAYMLVLVYFGVFAQMMAFLVNFIIGQGGLTADLSKLYAPTSIWLMALVAGLAFLGFYASRAGEPLFGKGFDPA